MPPHDAVAAVAGVANATDAASAESAAAAAGAGMATPTDAASAASAAAPAVSTGTRGPDRRRIINRPSRPARTRVVIEPPLLDPGALQRGRHPGEYASPAPGDPNAGTEGPGRFDRSTIRSRDVRPARWFASGAGDGQGRQLGVVAGADGVMPSSRFPPMKSLSASTGIGRAIRYP